MMTTRLVSRPLAVGLVGLETTGVADRLIAMDILHALAESHHMRVVFHQDMAYDLADDIWRSVATVEFDLLLVALRPGAAVLLDDLDRALGERTARGLSVPLVVFGGTTAYTAHQRIHAAPAMVWTGDAETGWTPVLDRLRQHAPHLTIEHQRVPRFMMPAHYSTRRSVDAGGTVWVEASRSCPLRCSFCVLSDPDLDVGWLPRPVSDLFDEVEHVTTTYGATDLSFSDYSAFETTGYTRRFLDAVRERRVNFTFRADMRLGTLRKLRGYLPELYAAGLRAVYVGVESFVSRQRTTYAKGYPGKGIIELVRAQGIFVAAGFITLDPMYTPEEFRTQVRGIVQHNLLDSIATPFKTIRIQAGTAYEQQARKLGIVGDINPDGYTYAYRCVDPRLEIVRRVVEFFHRSTKDFYYNPYIENNVRERRDAEDWQRQTLRGITRRYKAAQWKFLEELAVIATEHDNILSVRDRVGRVADQFSQTRATIFEKTAQDYEALLSRGMQHYRADLVRFIDHWRSVPEFTPEILANAST
jgi:radical SAM superfamily enzyme YgiQ (UPF0313 family)